MASGKGTRLKSKRPKTLHEIGGKPLLLHIIAAAAQIAAAGEHLRHRRLQRRPGPRRRRSTGVTFVQQDEPHGTGHAIQQVKAYFKGKTPPKNLLVLSGDVPLIRPETIAAMCDLHLREHAAMTILSAGSRRSRRLWPRLCADPAQTKSRAIVEQKDLPAGTSQRMRSTPASTPSIRRSSSSISTSSDHQQCSRRVLPHRHRRHARRSERKSDRLQGRGSQRILGANTIAELMDFWIAALRLPRPQEVDGAGRHHLPPGDRHDRLRRHRRPGHHHRTLRPAPRRYQHRLRTAASAPTPSSRTRSWPTASSSATAASWIGAPSPTARCSAPTRTCGRRADIGETRTSATSSRPRKSTLGKGSKANHLSYLGDAVIGAGVNIGAGVITCNYDGVNKNTTTIGDGVFVGSDSTLVAPLTLADGSYVAAGSCITESVPKDALALARSQQVTKPGWAARRRAKQAAKKP